MRTIAGLTVPFGKGRHSSQLDSTPSARAEVAPLQISINGELNRACERVKQAATRSVNYSFMTKFKVSKPQLASFMGDKMFDCVSLMAVNTKGFTKGNRF